MSRNRRRNEIDATGKAKTGGYAPNRISLWRRPRDLPVFTFGTINQMLMEPTLRLGLAMRAAPVLATEFAYKDQTGAWKEGVKSNNEVIGAFALRQLKRIWQNGVDHLVSAQTWGWAGGEVLLRRSPQNVIEYDRLLPRHATDIKARVCGSEIIGIQVQRCPTEEGGRVDLKFPNAVFVSHAAEPGEHYGTSVLTGAYSPWWDKWMQHGALDSRRLFCVMNSHSGRKLRYPNGTMYIEGRGEVPNRDIAREIVETMMAGAVVTLPSSLDANGNPEWTLEEPKVTGGGQEIMQLPKDLDTEQLRGLEIPDDVLESEAGGAWQGKQVPMMAFYSGLELFRWSILRPVIKQIVEPLIELNFGPGHWIDVDVKPLAVAAMEQQKGGGGSEQQDDGKTLEYQSGQSRPGLPQPRLPGLPATQGQEPQRMSLEESVGRGLVRASEIIRLADRAVAMSLDTNGAEHSEANGQFTGGKGGGSTATRKRTKKAAAPSTEGKDPFTRRREAQSYLKGKKAHEVPWEVHADAMGKFSPEERAAIQSLHRDTLIRAARAGKNLPDAVIAGHPDLQKLIDEAK